MYRKFLFIVTSSVMLFLLLTQLGNYRVPAATKTSCVTTACHAGMGTDKFVHGPVAQGECEVCHEQTGKHKFKPITKVEPLCEQCHEPKNTKKVLHPPVKEGKCTKCHSPHQSPYKYQLRAQGSGLCFMCHDKSIVGGKFVHGPAAEGACTACHSPHGTDIPKLLKAQGNDLCFTCHTDKAEEFKSAKFIHPPARDACINCHSPHSGGYQYNLPADASRDLCFMCHSEKEQQIKDAAVPHKALLSEKKCLTCHDPHFAKYVKQLKKQPVELCLSCHDKEYNDASGKLANMKSVLANNSDHHGPIKQGDCAACHNPHGSGNFRMLREYFPPVFYASYDPDNYKLCFMCHQKTIASEERTTTLTNFRNGDLNLHFIHVNRLVKGRTCRACHDPHATNNPKHIRDSVPFGTWNLPINYSKTPTGGVCMPGCHNSRGYDREKQVVNK